MKRKSWLWMGGCVALLLCGMAAIAAEEPAKVAGNWEMSFEGPRGTVTQTLAIEQDGAKIKGTLKGPRGESPLEGTLEGNKISFAVKRNTPRGEMTLEYTGTVDGDSMKGTMSGGQFSGDWTAKRASEK